MIVCMFMSYDFQFINLINTAMGGRSREREENPLTLMEARNNIYSTHQGTETIFGNLNG